MAFQMKLNTDDVRNWVNNQPNRDRAKRQALTLIKNELVQEVLKEIGQHTTTGQLENSVLGVADDTRVQIKSAMYGDIVLEYGRRPGKFPPVEPLERWAVQHGMDRGMGYVIARNIARRGTKKYRTGSPKQISEIEERLNREIMPEKMRTLLNEYTK